MRWTRSARITGLVFALLLAVGAAIATRPAPPQIPDVVRRFMDREGIPGAVVAFGAAGRAPTVMAIGAADTVSGRPMRADMIFRLASLSKPLTAAAVMSLVAQGKIGLDEHLADISAEVGQAADPRHRDITVRLLLQHGGGWDRASSFDPLLDDAEAQRRLGFAAGGDCAPIARAMLALPLDTAPGTVQSYSNLGYCWLAAAIARRAGMAYEDYVRTAVLAPLGLPEIRLGEAEQPEERLVRHHLNAGGRLAPLPRGAASETWLRRLGPAGGWTGTAADFYRFAAVAPPGETATRPGFAAAESYYGLGWRIWPDASGPLLTHAGFVDGVFTLAVRTADGDVAVALFNANTRTDSLAAMQRLIFELRAALPTRAGR
ncbi:serine hydrolase domain-containing protein [Desertibaculum subflavum]|uniref:serine hydrolase domain-containing protein n=1 Tax=Desertibaculum subflavum TaxID=2268458 RepID=UPI0013C4739E